MVSAAITVNGNPISQTGPSGANVTASSTVTLALASLSGVASWSIVCTSADDMTSTATINSTLVITGFTATFTAPSLDGYRGRAMQFTSTVNAGSYNQNSDTIGVFVLNTDGERLFFGGESDESNATVGNAADLNAMKVAIARLNSLI
jgi:hypothetical protein